MGKEIQDVLKDVNPERKKHGYVKVVTLIILLYARKLFLLKNTVHLKVEGFVLSECIDHGLSIYLG